MTRKWRGGGSRSSRRVVDDAVPVIGKMRSLPCVIGATRRSLTGEDALPYRGAGRFSAAFACPCLDVSALVRGLPLAADPALPTVPPAPTGVVMSKRTFQPNNRRRAKKHGFRLRMRTRAGRSILNARRRKGRSSISA